MRKHLALAPVLALVLSGLARAQDVSHSEDVVSALESLYEKASEVAAPCVVSIRIEREPEEKKANPSGRNMFGGLGSMMDGGVFKNRPEKSPVTGTILEEDGTIVTTAFNVSGKLKTIEVMLADGRTFKGELKGMNANYDIAVIKIEATGLPTLKRAVLAGLKTGQTVVALGRAPDRKGLTVNPGIVSAPLRISGKGLQMDSRMNYGNVGGPLVDVRGHLVGITCRVDQKHAGDYGQNSGVGFAITWDKLNDVLPDLKEGKSVLEAKRPFLGIQGADPNPEAEVEGVEVKQVIEGSAAKKAGIKVGDVITAFNGEKVKTMLELHDMIGTKRAGDKVKIKLVRDGQEMEIEAVLGEAAGE